MTPLTADAVSQARSDFAHVRPYVEHYGARKWSEGMAARSHDVSTDEDTRAWQDAYCGAWWRLARKERRARRLPDLLRLIERFDSDIAGARARADARFWLEHDIDDTGVIACGGLDRYDSCDGATDAPHTCWRHSRIGEIAERMVRLRDFRAARRAA